MDNKQAITEEMKSYNWVARRSRRDIWAHQGELTLGQKQELLILFSNLGLPSDAANPMQAFVNIKLGDLLAALKKNGALVKFLRIILDLPYEHETLKEARTRIELNLPKDERAPVTDEDIEDMTYATEKVIFADFFTCNAALLSDLTRWFAPMASNPSPLAKGDRSAFAKLFTALQAAIFSRSKKSKESKK